MSADRKSLLLSRTVRLLPCRLTDEEALKYGDALASVLQDIGAEESRQASVKQELKARLTQLEARRDELVTKVSRREEMRDVETETILSAEHTVVCEVRKDTGEVLRERPSTDQERQEQLPGLAPEMTVTAGALNLSPGRPRGSAPRHGGVP